MVLLVPQRLAAVLALVALVVASFGRVVAQVPQQNFEFDGNGAQNVVVGSASQCAVNIFSSSNFVGGTFTVNAETTSSGPWTQINGNTAADYSGANIGMVTQPPSLLYYNTTSYYAIQLSFNGAAPNAVVRGWVQCATPGTPTPSSGGTPAAGNCISVSTPPAAGTITNICTPYPTPSDASPCPGYPAGCVALNSTSPSPAPRATIAAQGGGFAVSGTGQMQTLVLYPGNGTISPNINAIGGCSIVEDDLCFYFGGAAGLGAADIFTGNALSNGTGFAVGGGNTGTGAISILQSGSLGNAGAAYTTIVSKYNAALSFSPCGDTAGATSPVQLVAFELCYGTGGAITGGTPFLWISNNGRALFRGGVGADDSTPPPFGVSGGVESPNPNPTPFYLIDNNAGSTSGLEGFRMATTHGCAAAADTFLNMLAGGVSVFLVDCQGDVTVPHTLNVGTLTGIAGTAVCVDGSENLTTSSCASGGTPALACSGLATCSPNSGPTPGILVPTPQATGCLVVQPVTGPPPNVMLNATGCGGGALPTSTPFQTVISGTLGVQNAWSLSDTGAFAGNCPGTFAPYVGLTSIATPAPAPSGLLCGSKTIASDGNASVYFPGTSTDYLVFPNVMPSSSPSAGKTWTAEMAIQSGGNAGGTSTRSSFFVASNTVVVMCTNESASGPGALNLFTAATIRSLAFSGGTCTANKAALIDVVYNAGSCWVYVNGVAVATPTTNSGSCTSVANQNATGFLGRDSGTTQNFLGVMSDLSIYTTALSPTTVQQHYFAFRCGGQYVGACVP